MEVIMLPMVEEDVALKSAFETMRTVGRSGIIWHRASSDFRLFTAGQLAFAGTKYRLSELNGLPIAVVDLGSVAESQPYIDSQRLHNSLLPSNRYGLLAAGRILSNDPQALVFAQSREDILYLEPEPADCYCAGPIAHKIKCGTVCTLHRGSAAIRVLL
jgi:hypothetical protein